MDADTPDASGGSSSGDPDARHRDDSGGGGPRRGSSSGDGRRGAGGAAGGAPRGAGRGGPRQGGQGRPDRSGGPARPGGRRNGGAPQGGGRNGDSRNGGGAGAGSGARDAGPRRDDRAPRGDDRPRDDRGDRRGDPRRSSGRPGDDARGGGRDRNGRPERSRPDRDRPDRERSDRPDRSPRPTGREDGRTRGGRDRERPPPRVDHGPGAEGVRRREEQDDRPVAPPLPEDVTPDLLDADTRRDLRGLPKDLADDVARHLVAVGELIDDDPETALAHARYARHRGSRVAVVREACGLAAYHAGEWAEALSELRASRRMGGAGHVPVMADAERALGRPERALEVARSPEARDLPPDEAMELLIVVSGARRDLGQADAAVVGLQVPELDVTRTDPWTPRLFYAYGEALHSAGRVDDAVRAFLDAASTDAEGETDAEERAAVLAMDTPPS